MPGHKVNRNWYRIKHKSRVMQGGNSGQIVLMQLCQTKLCGIRKRKVNSKTINLGSAIIPVCH